MRCSIDRGVDRFQDQCVNVWRRRQQGRGSAKRPSIDSDSVCWRLFAHELDGSQNIVLFQMSKRNVLPTTFTVSLQVDQQNRIYKLVVQLGPRKHGSTVSTDRVR